MSGIVNAMYSKLPNLVLGFHGCSKDAFEAVIQQIHAYNEKCGYEAYDSIRGVFTEGSEVYPGSGFVEKTHTQLCIVTPNCIKGYFAPIEQEDGYRIP